MLITAVLVASMAAPAAQAKTGTPAFERPAEFAGRTLNEISREEHAAMDVRHAADVMKSEAVMP